MSWLTAYTQQMMNLPYNSFFDTEQHSTKPQQLQHMFICDTHMRQNETWNHYFYKDLQTTYCQQ